MVPQEHLDSSDDIEQIVKQLSCRKPEQRLWAERRLREFGPKSVQHLLNILAQEGQKRNKRRSIIIGIVLGYMLVMLTIAILVHKPAMLSSIGSIGGMMAAAFAISQTQKSITLVLSQLDDVRTVGALLEGLEFQDKQIALASEASLIRLLPKLKASDAYVLNAQQHAILIRSLGRKSPALIVATLKAFEQVGDEQDLPSVQRLADGGGAGSNTDVRTAARACLPALMRRSEEERMRHTLVRAASAVDPVVSGDTLLRPASGVSTVNPQELVRSTSAGAETVNGESDMLTLQNVAKTLINLQNEEPTVLTTGHQGHVS